MKVAVGYRNVCITVTFLASVNKVISEMRDGAPYQVATWKSHSVEKIYI